MRRLVEGGLLIFILGIFWKHQMASTILNDAPINPGKLHGEVVGTLLTVSYEWETPN
jgi:hypothetical protein